MVNVGIVADRSKAKRYVLDFICQVHGLCSDFVLNISRIASLIRKGNMYFEQKAHVNRKPIVRS